MKLLDTRRLTGAHRMGDGPGAIAEVELGFPAQRDALVAAWHEALRVGGKRLSWSEADAPRNPRTRDTGAPGGPARVELLFDAPVDRLYAATELNEWAIQQAAHTLGFDLESPDAIEGDLNVIAERMRAEIAEREGLMELLAAAASHGVPALVDDDEVSVGYACRSRTWPMSDLPSPSALDWPALGSVPVALITGTNGKTTTSRMLARILHRADVRAGNTSTDGICVDEALVERGDWTGPGAARALLRRSDLEMVILETARGGLLRRGVEVRGARGAAVTNVDRDHMGEYGVHTLADMAEAKGLVARALADDGALVLDANSPALVAWARVLDPRPRVEWVQALADGAVPEFGSGVVWTTRERTLVRCLGDTTTPIVSVGAIPATFDGRARHNVANALTACALAHALGLPLEAGRGLEGFGADPADNPGRARFLRVPHPNEGEVEVLIDFAHNRAGIQAVESIAAGPHAPLLSFGMAGDRSDDDLRDLGRVLAGFGPRVVVLREQAGYERGRAPGETRELVREGLIGLAPDTTVVEADTEVESLDRALEFAEPGQRIVLLVHLERESVDAWLDARGARPARP